MKKIKTLTIILIILVISMIGFLGVYKQEQNRMVNQVKDNSYAMDLSGLRTIRIKLSEDSQTVIKDAEGNEVEDADSLTDEEISQKGYVKEEIPDNAEEIKTVENYRKTKEILEQRMKEQGVDNYVIKLNEQTGEIIIETTENDKIDQTINLINTRGKLEISDTDTGEVLLNNDDIETVRVASKQTNATTGAITICLDIEFNKEGAKKLEEVTNNYKTIVEETDEEENTQTEETDETDENSQTEENDETAQTSEEEQKTIDLKIDDEVITSTSFDETIDTGIIELSTSAETTDTETLQSNIEQATNMATIFNSGNIPLQYQIEENQYVETQISNNTLKTIAYVTIGIIAIAMLILIIKYRLAGVFSAFSYIGFIASLILVIKYTNVILSFEGIFSMAMILILNYIFVNQLLKKSNSMKTYKEFFVKIIPIIILTIVFSLINWTPINSFGTVAFWGIVLIAVYNMIITSNLIKIKEGKEQ